MKVRWSAESKVNLRAIGRYIARDKPIAGRAWVQKLRQCAHDAADIPWMGRVVPEFCRPDVREVFLRTYRIVYRIAADHIVVVKVVDGRKRLEGVDPDV